MMNRRKFMQSVALTFTALAIPLPAAALLDAAPGVFSDPHSARPEHFKYDIERLAYETWESAGQRWPVWVNAEYKFTARVAEDDAHPTGARLHMGLDIKFPKTVLPEKYRTMHLGMLVLEEELLNMGVGLTDDIKHHEKYIKDHLKDKQSDMWDVFTEGVRDTMTKHGLN